MSFIIRTLCRKLLEFSDVTALLQNLQRHINSLSSTNIRTRRLALQHLHDTLFAEAPVSCAGQPTDAYFELAAAEDAQFAQPSAMPASPPSAQVETELVPSSSSGAASSPGQAVALPALPAFQPGGDSDDEDTGAAAAGSMLLTTSHDIGGASRRGELLRGILPELLKPLQLRVGDTSEPCRELALAMLARFVPHTAQLKAYLDEVLPVVMERLPLSWSFDMQHNAFVQDGEAHQAFLRGRVVSEDDPARSKVVDTSEECRSLVCSVLFALLRRCAAVGARHMLDGHAHDLVLATAVHVWDPFPDLKVQACVMLQHMCTIMPHVMKVFAIGFAKHLGPNLTHRYARVRLAALAALQDVVAVPKPEKRKGAGTEAIAELVGYREENVVPIRAFYGQEVRHNYFASLAADGNPAVRARFIKMLGEWLWSLPDRWDHESRLLPYLLSALGDGATEISLAAFAWLENFGARYEVEKADDLIDEKQHDIDGDIRVDYDQPLPLPFSAGRPRRGLRLVVRNNCRRFFKPILAELGDWKGSTRRSAAGLLVTVLVFLEEMITQDAAELLRVLAKTVDDSELGDLSRTAARLTGRFVPPSAYVPLVLPLLQDGSTASQVRAAGASDTQVVGSLLRVLALLVSESRPSQVLPHVGAILSAASCERVLTAVARDTTPAVVTVGQAAPDQATGGGEGAFASAVAAHKQSLQDAAATATNMQFAFADTTELYWRLSDVRTLGAGATSDAPLPKFGVSTGVRVDATGFLRAQESMQLPLVLPTSPYDAQVPSNSVRGHFVSLLAALSRVLQGRVGAFSGAAFDASGRLGDGRQLVHRFLSAWAVALGSDSVASASVPSPRRCLALVGQRCLAAFAASNPDILAASSTLVHGNASSTPALVSSGGEVAKAGAGRGVTGDAPHASVIERLCAAHCGAIVDSALLQYPLSSFWSEQNPSHCALLFVLEHSPAATLSSRCSALASLAKSIVQSVLPELRKVQPVAQAELPLTGAPLRAALFARQATSQALAASHMLGAEQAETAEACRLAVQEACLCAAMCSPVQAGWSSSEGLARGWLACLHGSFTSLPSLQCADGPTKQAASQGVELLLQLSARGAPTAGSVAASVLPSIAMPLVSLAVASDQLDLATAELLAWVGASTNEAARRCAASALGEAAFVGAASAELVATVSTAALESLYGSPTQPEDTASALLGTVFAMCTQHHGAVQSALGGFVSSFPDAVQAGRTALGREDWAGHVQGHLSMLGHLAGAATAMD